MKKGILGLAVLMMAMATDVAMAAKLSNFADNARGEFSSFLQLGVTFSYVAGFFILLMSIFKFKAHSDDARQTPMKTPVTLLLVAVFFLGAPTLLGAGGASIFGEGAQATKLDGSGSDNIGF
jgi:hypothetical protein